MSNILPFGVALFIFGVMLSNVMFVVSRMPWGKKDTSKSTIRVMMWLSVALAALGLVLGGIGYLYAGTLEL